MDDYRPELEKVVQERAEKKEKEKRAQLDKMMKDMKLAKGRGQNDKAEEEEEADLQPSYDGDGQIMDPVSEIYLIFPYASFTEHFPFPIRIPTKKMNEKMSFPPLGFNSDLMAALGQSLNKIGHNVYITESSTNTFAGVVH